MMQSNKCHDMENLEGSVSTTKIGMRWHFTNKINHFYDSHNFDGYLKRVLSPHYTILSYSANGETGTSGKNYKCRNIQMTKMKSFN